MERTCESGPELLRHHLARTPFIITLAPTVTHMKRNSAAFIGLALALFALLGALFPDIGGAIFPNSSPRVPSAIGALFFSITVSFVAFLSLAVGFFSVRLRDAPLLSWAVAVLGLAALWSAQRAAFAPVGIFVVIAYAIAFLLSRRRG